METSAPTLGERLDSVIQQIDSLSSMQLYSLIVGFTIVIASLLLGSANVENEYSSELLQSTASRLHHKTTTTTQRRYAEPKWHIFKWVNYAAVLTFGWSVVDFTMHCSVYLHDSDTLLKFLVAWSVFICYCFGFFGISFVHDTATSDESGEPEEQSPRLVSPDATR